MTYKELGIPDRPLVLTCDFCHALNDRMWFISHRGFGLRIPILGNTTFVASMWAACVYCKPLFDERDYGSLIARVVTLSPTAMLVPLADIFGTLGQCVYGDWVPWEAGQSVLPFNPAEEAAPRG
jgi:hypothetical protein